MEKKPLEYLAVKLCEKLPLNITLFEKDGFCGKPNNICKYYREKKNNHLCYKKTYTFKHNISTT